MQRKKKARKKRKKKIYLKSIEIEMLKNGKSFFELK
jgi:hypothetical protein